MVIKLSIGIIGIQGSISEHINAMSRALKETKIPGNVFVIKKKEDISELDALLIPGGESTTISKELYRSGLYDEILKRVKKDNLPIMGTCAGCVLLANKLYSNGKDIKLLKIMDMQVARNAMGRQKESFEKKIKIKGFSEPYNAIFIRAPIIEMIWGNCKILSKMGNKILIAEQGNKLAITFHPELTNDLRIHKYFLNLFSNN
jgi:5'-phosphate synthase pdxT subunit